jgi:hypothetical protein
VFRGCEGMGEKIKKLKKYENLISNKIQDFRNNSFE